MLVICFTVFDMSCKDTKKRRISCNLDKLQLIPGLRRLFSACECLCFCLLETNLDFGKTKQRLRKLFLDFVELFLCFVKAFFLLLWNEIQFACIVTSFLDFYKQIINC